MYSPKTFVFITLLSLASWTNGAPVQQPESENTELQGTWEGLHSSVGDIKRMFKPGEVRLVFSGKTLTATGLLGPEARAVEFRLDSTKTPKEFDYTKSATDVVQCIYQLEGNTLTIAVPRASVPRPERIDFASKAIIVMVLERRR